MNHNGSTGQAKSFIDAVAETGADAVKFQAHIAEAETLKNAPTPTYFNQEPRFEYFKRTSFDKSQLTALKEHAESLGLIFICSPFSIPAVDLLENVNVAAYKIPSGEITNLPLLEYIAQKGKPIIISSGMSNLSELEEALSLIRRFNQDVVIMQCTSEYPCSYENVGLNLIHEFKQRFDLPVGLSDHTLTIFTSIAAIVLGACIIEKHFTLSEKMYGPDAKFSLTPEEFGQMVNGIRAVETALSHPVDKDDIENFDTMRSTFQKSIVSVVDIPKGAEIREDMISIKKPGDGIHPKYFSKIIGRKVLRDISEDTLIHEEDVDWETRKED
ncbi:N-acetylneuraminate synthase family protein [Chloroflexota bacterium]